MAVSLCISPCVISGSPALIATKRNLTREAENSSQCSMKLSPQKYCQKMVLPQKMPFQLVGWILGDVSRWKLTADGVQSEEKQDQGDYCYVGDDTEKDARVVEYSAL